MGNVVAVEGHHVAEHVRGGAVVPVLPPTELEVLILQDNGDINRGCPEKKQNKKRIDTNGCFIVLHLKITEKV